MEGMKVFQKSYIDSVLRSRRRPFMPHEHGEFVGLNRTGTIRETQVRPYSTTTSESCKTCKLRKTKCNGNGGNCDKYVKDNSTEDVEGEVEFRWDLRYDGGRALSKELRQPPNIDWAAMTSFIQKDFKVPFYMAQTTMHDLTDNCYSKFESRNIEDISSNHSLVKHSFEDLVLCSTHSHLIFQPLKRLKRQTPLASPKEPRELFSRDSRSAATEPETERHDLIGALLLFEWKKTAGKSKDWKSCRRYNVRQSLHKRQELMPRRQRETCGWGFSLSSTPITLLRSQAHPICKPWALRKWKRSTRCLHADSEESETLELSDGLEFRGNSQPSEPGYLPCPPPHRILRLTLYQGAITVKHDNFLREGQILQNVFKVQKFIRDENHADLYLLQGLYLDNRLYYAYVFLEGPLPGNWGTFAKRKMKRLQKARLFHKQFIHEGRTLIVMEEDQRPREFTVDNMEQEFPSLPSQVSCENVTTHNIKRSKPALNSSSAAVANIPVGNEKEPISGKKRRALTQRQRENRAAKQSSKRREQRIAKRLGLSGEEIGTSQWLKQWLKDQEKLKDEGNVDFQPEAYISQISMERNAD